MDNAARKLSTVDDQLPLFEGHRVDMMTAKIKSGFASVDRDKGAPKMNQERKFLVTATVRAINHELVKENLVRVAVFEVDSAEEIS